MPPFNFKNIIIFDHRANNSLSTIAKFLLCATTGICEDFLLMEKYKEYSYYLYLLFYLGNLTEEIWLQFITSGNLWFKKKSVTN